MGRLSTTECTYLPTCSCELVACTAHLSMESDSLPCHRQRRSYFFG